MMLARYFSTTGNQSWYHHAVAVPVAAGDGVAVSVGVPMAVVGEGVTEGVVERVDVIVAVGVSLGAPNMVGVAVRGGPTVGGAVAVRVGTLPPDVRSRMATSAGVAAAAQSEPRTTDGK